MRCVILTLWSSLAVALSAALMGDASTEWFSNLVASGPGGFDLHQESLAPTALLAAIVTAGLCIAVLFQHLRTSDAFVRLHRSPGARAIFVVTTAIATMAIVVAMERYEMRFGGVAAFDPRSVITQHLAAVMAAYALIGWTIDRVLAACLCVACRAADAIALAVVAILRRMRAISAHAVARVHRVQPNENRPERVRPACGLRAPPVACEYSHSHTIGGFSWSVSRGGP